MNKKIEIADAKAEERTKVEKEAIKKTAKFARDFGISEVRIFETLLNDYGNNFSKAEIEQLINEI